MPETPVELVRHLVKRAQFDHRGPTKITCDCGWVGDFKSHQAAQEGFAAHRNSVGQVQRVRRT